MSTPLPEPLQLRVRGLLSAHCEVVRAGAVIGRTSTLYWPMRTAFELDGVAWRTGTAIGGGRGIDLLRYVFVAGVLGRETLVLHAEGAAPCARARARGHLRPGYDLQLDGRAASLAPEDKTRRHRFASALGEGVCEFVPAQRTLRIALPAALPVAQQVFVGLLVLRRWIRWSNTNG